MTDIFDAPKTTDTNPGNQEGDQSTQEFLAKYVGEDKKYKSPDDLAKAYDHAVSHINKIEGEQRELREDLAQRTTLEEFVRQLRPQDDTTNNPPSEHNQQTVEGNGTEVVKNLSADEIKALAQEEFNRSRQEEQREQNARNVKSDLIKNLGADYNVHVTRRIDELGLTQAQAQNMAETNPKVFLELIGKRDFGQPGDGAPPKGTQLPGGTQRSTGTAKTNSFYRELRKQDPSRYYSPLIQNQKFKDASELGDAFFD